MSEPLPSADQVSALLRPLRMAQLRALADVSGVPFRTLLNIRLGVTKNPGIETVRSFYNLVAPLPAKGVDAVALPGGAVAGSAAGAMSERVESAGA